MKRESVLSEKGSQALTGRMHDSAEAKAVPHHRSALPVTVNFCPIYREFITVAKAQDMQEGSPVQLWTGLKLQKPFLKNIEISRGECTSPLFYARI